VSSQNDKSVAIEQEKRQTEQVEKLYGDGIEALDKRRFTEALDSFKAVIQLKPNHVEAHFYGGYCYTALEDFDMAIYFYKRAIRLKPDYADALFRIGVAYDKLGRHQEAIEAYKEAARIDPARVSVYYNMGIAYGKLEGTMRDRVVPAGSQHRTG
jgi:tetratricopeptide (TPR) repeat protein